jgi:DNA-binding CsgD family transcriptional regulator
VFISVILFIVLVLSIIFPFYNIAGFLIIIFLITAVIFAIVFDSINHLKPEFIKKKKIYSIGSKIALIFLPFLLFIDIFRDAIPVIKNKIPGGYYSVPFFFIFLSVFTILEIHEYYKFLKERHLSEKVNSCILKKYSLSDKEIEVLKLLMDGYSYIEIGIFLYISTERVKTHISRIYRKTETTNKIELFKLVTSN